MTRDYDPELTSIREEENTRHNYWPDICDCCKFFFVAFVIITVIFLPSTLWTVWTDWDDV